MLVLELGLSLGEVHVTWTADDSDPIDREDSFSHPVQDESPELTGQTELADSSWDDNSERREGNMWTKNLNRCLAAGLAAMAISGTAIADEEWSNSYNGAGSLSDEPAALVVDSDLNAYVAGASEAASGGFDGLLLKYDTDGGLDWSDAYDGSPADEDMWLGTVSDGAGGVYVTGFVTGADGTDLATARYSSDGSRTWIAFHDESDETAEEGRRVLVLGDGSIVCVGTVVLPGGAQNVVMAHYGADGTELGSSTWSAGVDLTTRFRDASLGADGNVLVCGVAGAIGDLSGTSNDVFAARLEIDGTELWSYVYDSGDGDGITKIRADSANNVFLAGQSGLGVASITTIRLLADGTEDWVASYTGDAMDNLCNGLSVDADGNAIVVGSKTTASGVDFLALKYGATGGLVWENSYDSSSSGDDEARDVVVDDANGVYVTGSVGDVAASGTRGIVTIKYDAGGSEEWFELYEMADSSVVEAVSIDRDAIGRVLVGGAVFPDSTESFNVAILAYGDATSDVDPQAPSALPAFLELGQNFPNPAQFGTAVRYALPRGGRVRISLYDLGGRLLSVALDQEHEPGYHQFELPVGDLSSGVYFYKLDWGRQSRTRKLTVSR